MFVSSGLCLNGQDEIVIYLKCKTDEKTNEIIETEIPKQVLYHIMDVYEKSSKGYRITSMTHVIYDFESAKNSSKNLTDNESNFLLENKENIGFLYFRPTVHHRECCLKPFQKQLPSEEPFLIGLLIQKLEITWAKLFPLRLLLRFGEKFGGINNLFLFLSDLK